MGDGYATKSFDLDLTDSDSSEAMFHLLVTQEFAPDTIGAEILFHKVFES